jgi:hypothetical protein
MNQELEYLRDEMNQRLTYLYEHPHKVLGHLLLLWGGTLVLFNITGKNFMEDIFSFFIVSTIFFISVLMIYPFSQREYENWKQISKIAAYNAIFYEKRPCDGDKEEGKFYWELVNFEITIKEKKNSGEKPNLLSYDYFIFSLIAIGINLFLFFLLFFKFSKTLEAMIGAGSLIIGADFFIIIIDCCYIVVSALLSMKIYKNTIFNPENWYEERKKYLKSFMNYAIETKTIYYSKEKIKERLGKDIWKELDDSKRSSQ